jgi:glycine betaine/proline transport system ATP-binding protein
MPSGARNTWRAGTVPDPLIRVENLYKVFGDDPQRVMKLVREGRSKDDILARTGHAIGLRDISLEIEKGSIFVVMGLSGSGKSTLIRHLNRLIDPTEGTIHIDGTDMMSLSRRQLEEFRRHKMSMVFQGFGLMPHRTVLENVAFGLAVRKMPRAEREERPPIGCTPSAWKAMATDTRRSSRADSASVSASPARCVPSRRSCSWTSRSRRSIR